MEWSVVNGQLHVPFPLPLAKEPSLAIELEAGWTPAPVWTVRTSDGGIARNSSVLGGCAVLLGKNT
jgi:hypothetical protein